MVDILEVEHFLKGAKGGVIIDVRSPSEFEMGHIEGAYNIPLFSDSERAIVGTIYKQIGKEQAVEKGLEFVSVKMVDMVRKAKELSSGRKVFVYCWRGGMRSNSVAWLFSTAGLRTALLNGGYKGYRSEFDSLVEKFNGNLIVLGGPTGGGKSAILNQLKRLGEQVVDLEGLANHKGSVFGSMGKQPTTETFINKLHFELSQFDSNKRLWCEGESKAIGSVYIPEAFYKLMHQSRYIYMDIPRDARLDRIVEEYGVMSTDDLKMCFEKVTRRMGGQNVKAAIESINGGDIRFAAALALDYYDKGYKNSVYSSRDISTITTINFDSDDVLQNALALKNMVDL